MRSISIILILSFTLTTILESFSVVLAGEEKLVVIGVIDLDAKGISPLEAAELSDHLRFELSEMKMFDVIEWDRMRNILEEKGFQLPDVCDQSCVVEVGRLIGVEKMVAGDVGKTGNIYTISLRLVDVETGRIEKTVTEDFRGEIDEFLIVIGNSVKKVAEPIVGKPMYKRWWFWTLISGAVAGGVIAATKGK